MVFVGNRDEFHARPAAPANWWDDSPNLLAGRDLQAGGTWLGASRNGRFAVVTNFREVNVESGERSRGELVVRYLQGLDDSEHWSSLQERAGLYGGFNLLFTDGKTLGYFSNRGMQRASLEPGIYALSNHFLDTPWPKVTRIKRDLNQQLLGRWDESSLLQLLRDQEKAPDSDLPDTGVGRDLERFLSPAFIISNEYGTRCSSVVTLSDPGEFGFSERRYGPGGTPIGSSYFQFIAE
jgi:uncharacterized protein with NRDE domain